MEKEIEILLQYTQADSFRRMHMFLQSPDLRNVFQEIERKGLGAQRAPMSSAKQHHKRRCSRLASFLSRIIEIKILKKSGVDG